MIRIYASLALFLISAQDSLYAVKVESTDSLLTKPFLNNVIDKTKIVLIHCFLFIMH